jgi:hypothetical protein
MFDDLEGQKSTIVSQCIELVYFMRGAIQYDTFLEMTPFERKLVNEFLKRRMEIEGKRQNPIY